MYVRGTLDAAATASKLAKAAFNIVKIYMRLPVSLLVQQPGGQAAAFA